MMASTSMADWESGLLRFWFSTERISSPYSSRVES